MKIFRFIASIIILFLLIIFYAVSITIIKNEDFIGTYYCVNINPNYALEICGTETCIIDPHINKSIIIDVDSMTIVDDGIYGICKNKYFLLTFSNNKVVYSSIPMLQYSECNLLSPMEFYRRKTSYIDTLGLIVLLSCVIFVLKKFFF